MNTLLNWLDAYNAKLAISESQLANPNSWMKWLIPLAAGIMIGIAMCR